MASDPPAPSRGTMSLYANLLSPSPDSSATISRAPVVFKQSGDSDGKGDGSATKKPVNTALQFQPIRRPQVNRPKPKSMGFPKAIPQSATTGAATQKPSNAPAAPVPPTKSTLADWTAIEEDAALYGGEPKQKRKKKKKKKDEPIETDWDEIYDPARPTNVEEYMRSEERIREVKEWKEVLYRHRRKKEDSRSVYSEDEEDEELETSNRFKNNAFAPPPSYSFAPPPPSPPAANVPNDATGEDAYARRLAMSQGGGGTRVLPLPEPEPEAQEPPPPPPPQPPPPPPPEGNGATISRAPVRYAQPEPGPMDEDDDQHSPPHPPQDDADAPRSNRPGQVGFAQRLMSKYGWTAGTGLGASESGIINPLQVRVEKRRKKPDAEGGGYAEPGGRGKIIGGKVSKATREREAADDSGPGKMSNVIVLRRMLDGIPEAELEEELQEGGLQQEIGEECGVKYGRVERLYVDRGGKNVFIRFTDQVSALRAVNALEGRIFNGNAIVAKFFDDDKFQKGIYS